MKIIPYEMMKGAVIKVFKTDPKGKAKKVIKKKDWKGDPKKLKEQAEKYKE